MAWAVGYPIQKDQKIDLMDENEAAKLWEKLNAPDEYEDQMKKAAFDFVAAANLIDKAEEELSAAVADLYETPLQTVADELLERLMNFRYELTDLAKRYGRGER